MGMGRERIKLYVSFSYTRRGAFEKVFKRKNIYAVKLWPNVLWNGSNSSEKERVENMVLLPIDQRYSKDEMEYISKTVKEYCYQYQRK